MAISAIGAAGIHAGSQQTQSVSHHKHGGRRAASFSDIDSAGSSVASPPTSTGKIGSKLNITA